MIQNDLHGGTCMHTVERLEQALAAAERRGFVVRQDWLNGTMSATCELKGQRWLFIDLALSPAEQLAMVLDALSAADANPPIKQAEVREMNSLRKAA